MRGNGKTENGKRENGTGKRGETRKRENDENRENVFVPTPDVNFKLYLVKYSRVRVF